MIIQSCINFICNKYNIKYNKCILVFINDIDNINNNINIQLYDTLYNKVSKLKIYNKWKDSILNINININNNDNDNDIMVIFINNININNINLNNISNINNINNINNLNINNKYIVISNKEYIEYINYGPITFII
ncbi:hypothetical protein EHP00_2437 [Ecytonucleospora hepatopenaei]|uniref:Uncharacterized protein n=1 Tax=Ecytonucleospora hepatopenaei TaxID=646526 RepID=A0A1W0E2U6_9MICR|nr:hypothetical protein EHP00_2437 [Ecytonucleospora hepatopenaei]